MTGKLDWQDFAVCTQRHTPLFFEKTENGRFVYEAKAKAMCAQCSVRLPCLDSAMARPDTEGIWGGMTEGERRVLRRQRRDAETQVMIDAAVGSVVADVRDSEMRRLQGVL